MNPDLRDGPQAWLPFGNAKIEFKDIGHDKFVVARERKQPHDSVSQKVHLEKGRLYTFSGKNIYRVFCFLDHTLSNFVSPIYQIQNNGLLCFYVFIAWLQVNTGKAPVSAVFKTNGEYKHAGSVIAESKCWSMLKGGLTVDESGPGELYFEVIILWYRVLFIGVRLSICFGLGRVLWIFIFSGFSFLSPFVYYFSHIELG